MTMTNPMAVIHENNESIVLMSQWWEPYRSIVTNKAEYRQSKDGYWHRTERAAKGGSNMRRSKKSG